MIRLFDYWRSSASYRVRMALHLLDLPFETVTVDLLAGAQHSAENLARNPQAMVPTLEIDGLRLTQSVAILEYLDETRGGLLPQDAAGRARVRALSHAVAMDIAPICNLRVRSFAQSASGGAVTAESWQRHFIAQGLAAIEVMLRDPATGRFCHGDSVSMADLCLLPQLYNAGRLEIDLRPHPNLRRIAEALGQIAAIAAAHPDRVPH